MSKYFIFSSSFILFIFISGLYSQGSPDTLNIDEVVITSNRIEVLRSESPVSISIISNQDIQNQEETNILPIVALKTPGVFISEIGVAGYALGNGTSGQLTIRGLGGAPNARVMMMVDGQPQFMGIFGHPLPNFHMASNVEKVEVIRGPASLLYGSNAMGGVINVITKQSTKEGLAGNAYVSYGSFNTFKAGASAGFQKKDFSAGFSVNHAQTNGHRDSSEFDIINLHAFAKYDFNNWAAKVGFTIADYSFMDPGPENTNALTFMGDINRSMLTFSLNNNYESTSGGLYAFYNAGMHDFSDDWYSEDANYGINLYQSFNVWKDGVITAGIDMKKYGASGSFSNMGPPTFSLTTYDDTTLTVNERAAYLLLDQKVGDIMTISAGSRYDVHSLYGGELVPQIGLTVKPFQTTTVKGLLSKGFRNPTLMDLYLFPTSNAELGPERLWNYELSVGQRIGAKGIISTTAYLMDASNLITIEANDNPPPPVKKVNGGSFTNWGIELEGNYYLSENIEIDASYSYLNTSQMLLFAPRHQIYAGVRYAISKFSFVLNAKTVNGLYTKIDQETPSNNISQSYTLLNSRVSYNVLDKLQLYISGKNILNADYQTVYGYTMPGIHAMIGMNVSFNR